ERSGRTALARFNGHCGVVNTIDQFEAGWISPDRVHRDAIRKGASLRYAPVYLSGQRTGSRFANASGADGGIINLRDASARIDNLRQLAIGVVAELKAASVEQIEASHCSRIAHVLRAFALSEQIRVRARINMLDRPLVVVAIEIPGQDRSLNGPE